MKREKMDESKLNILTQLLNQLITTACGILVPRILIAAYGSEAYGISVSIAQFLSYITLFEGGIGGVARAKLYGPLAKNDVSEISSVYYAVRDFFNHVAVVFVAYSVILGLCYHDLAHVTIFSKTYIFLLVFSIGLATLAKYMGGLANLTLIVADKKVYINNLIMVGTTLINAIAIILLVKMGANLIVVKLGSSLIFIVRPIMYTYYVKKHYALIKSGKKVVLDQKWTGIGQHIAYFLHKNIDVVLLTLMADVRLVAVYSVYNMVISSIRSITEAFSGGMEAVFGEWIAKGDIPALQLSYRKYKTLISAASLVLFSCAGILIVPFIMLYTKEITDADYIQPAFALVFLVAEAVNCLVLPCSSLPVAANHLKQTRWGAYGEAMINIFLSCILIKWNPLLGVALGTLVATMFRAVYYMIYSAKNFLHLPVYRILLPCCGTIFLLCAIALCGAFLIQTVKIRNFFSWMLWGLLCLLIIALPVAAAVRNYIKRIQCRRQI